MKEPYLILTLLIMGTSSPGKDIDVFLRPLVDELKELWSEGIVEQDACNGNNSDCELLCYGLLMIFSLGAVYQDGVARVTKLAQHAMQILLVSEAGAKQFLLVIGVGFR